MENGVLQPTDMGLIIDLWLRTKFYSVFNRFQQRDLENEYEDQELQSGIARLHTRLLMWSRRELPSLWIVNDLKDYGLRMFHPLYSSRQSELIPIGRIMGLCAKVDTTNYNQQASTPERKADAEAALSVCPDAPHAALLQETVNTIKVASGDIIVGQTMEPGTWKTAPGIKDCYWSRNTGGGDIIANDFVGFAPDGVTVTVFAGEGFESSRCGIWTKIG